MGRDSKKLRGLKDIDVHPVRVVRTVVEVAESLRQSLVAHLECESTVSTLRHHRGAQTWMSGVVQSGGDHDGAHGHIVKAQDDGSYRVRLEDVSKVQWFTRQQLCEQENVIENPMQAPAAIFVLTDEWVASPLCVQKITLSLAARAGMDLSSLADVDIHKELLAMPHDKLSALRTGAFLVVSSDSSSVAVRQRRQLLTRTPDLAFHPRPSTIRTPRHHSTCICLGISGRKAAGRCKELRDEFVLSASNASVNRNLVANRKMPVARVAGRTSAMPGSIYHTSRSSAGAGR